MENEQTARFSVSDFLAVVNQTLEFGFGAVEVEGEVANYKVNQQKYVFFDLKDKSGLVNCFMTVWQVRAPITDGMRVVVRAVPKVTNWGKFSLTVQSVRPIGEGDIKKSQELLKEKLAKEGLFDESRKRTIPKIPQRVGVISSVEAAGYKDFVKILSERWGGLELEVAHVQVQGEASPGQIVGAINYFNLKAEPLEVLVLIRGGGSAEDLAGFSDERVVRAIASSRVPVVVGVGHEIDESLSDLVADVRASTPTHAAQILVPDRQEIKRKLGDNLGHSLNQTLNLKKALTGRVSDNLNYSLGRVVDIFGRLKLRHERDQIIIDQLNPWSVLARGYALVRGVDGKAISRPKIHDIVNIETDKVNIKAEVLDVAEKHN